MWTLDELAQNNNIPNKDLIYVGQKIIIAEEKVEEVKTEEKTRPSIETYIVKEGDSFWKIWKEQDLWENYGLAFSEFKEINRAKLKRPGDFDYIVPSQELIIQKQVASSTPETREPPSQFIHDDVGILASDDQNYITKSAQKLRDSANTIITVKIVEEVENEEEAVEIAKNTFTDYDSKLDRGGNPLNMLMILFKKIGEGDNKLLLMGFKDSEGGIMDNIQNKIDTQEIRTMLDNARTNQELSDVLKFAVDAYSEATELEYEEGILHDKVIVIDPGHGGKDSGAVNYESVEEKDVTLEVSNKLRNILEKANAIVILTRDTDVYVELAKRGEIGRCYNQKDRILRGEQVSEEDCKKANLFISVHANSAGDTPSQSCPSSTGTESLIYCECPNDVPGELDICDFSVECQVCRLGEKNCGVDVKNFDLATLIKVKIAEKVNIRERNLLGSDATVLSVLKEDIPAVLVETAFLCNPTEASLLTSQQGQLDIASSIYDGIKDYFA